MSRYVTLFMAFSLVPLSALAAEYAVTGVSPSDPDGLVMRKGPGPHYPIVTHIPAGATQISERSCRFVGSSRWCEIDYREHIGWVNARYLVEIDLPLSTADSPSPADAPAPKADDLTKDATTLVSLALRCNPPGHDDHGVYKVANTVYDGTYKEFVATIVGHEIGVRDSDNKTVEQSSETKITASFSQLHLKRLSADIVQLRAGNGSVSEMKMLLCAVAAITIGAIDNCSAHDGSACVKINKIVDDSYLTIRADNRCGSDIILRWTEKHEDGRVDTGGMTIDKCKDDSYVYQTGPRSTVDIYEYVTINPTALDCDKKLRPRHADPLGDTASQIKSRLGPAEARANQAAAQENDYFKDAYKRIEIENERNARKAQQEAAAESARQSEDAAWKAFAATAHGTKNNCSEIDDPNCVIDFDASDFPQLRGKCRKLSAALRATGRIFHFTACLH